MVIVRATRKVPQRLGPALPATVSDTLGQPSNDSGPPRSHRE
jgi:hypothetical protein